MTETAEPQTGRNGKEKCFNWNKETVKKVESVNKRGEEKEEIKTQDMMGKASRVKWYMRKKKAEI